MRASSFSAEARTVARIVLLPRLNGAGAPKVVPRQHAA